MRTATTSHETHEGAVEWLREVPILRFPLRLLKSPHLLKEGLVVYVDPLGSDKFRRYPRPERGLT